MALPQGEPSAAEAAPADAEATEFDRVVVTATRTERAISDVPNTVDVIDRARMDEILARDLKDLFRYEPGITVTSGFGRFGIGGIRIRGLDANRVRIQTDRSEEHTSELQSLMRISYAVFCLKKKKQYKNHTIH